jgi:hypothetical protein
MTTSNGRGARADQCSCFDTAISAQIPEEMKETEQKAV